MSKYRLWFSSTISCMSFTTFYLSVNSFALQKYCYALKSVSYATGNEHGRLDQ